MVGSHFWQGSVTDLPTRIQKQGLPFIFLPQHHRNLGCHYQCHQIHNQSNQWSIVNQPLSHRGHFLCLLSPGEWRIWESCLNMNMSKIWHQQVQKVCEPVYNKYILAESIKFYTGYHRFIILFFIVVIIFINKDNKRISSESIKVYDGYSSLRKRLFR